MKVLNEETYDLYLTLWLLQCPQSHVIKIRGLVIFPPLQTVAGMLQLPPPHVLHHALLDPLGLLFAWLDPLRLGLPPVLLDPTAFALIPAMSQLAQLTSSERMHRVANAPCDLHI